MTRLWRLALLALFAIPAAGGASGDPPGPIAWRSWSDGVFAEARREGRLVLLDLEAVWCHWCHVMDETTYRDAEVVALIRSRFVPLRVDQDARLDLSNRYEDYGWPATVVFDADGRELAKLQGYVPPGRMASLLRALADDPTPGPSVTQAPAPPERFAASGSLPDALRGELQALFVERYDTRNGGWGFVHKFLDWDSVEWSMARAAEGDALHERMARDTLSRQLGLLDPAWGGVYQYSDGGVWENPHFEKIMSMQAENLRIYAQAYALWRDPAHLRAAREIRRYLLGFLRSPQGAFYTSQDADVVKGRHGADYFALPDAERRRRGVPRVDTHVYTRENGWAIQALAALHAATGDAPPLREARQAAEWILAHRGLPGGGFRHGERDAAGPYLGDTLAAGRAFLALYAATAERAWLARAASALDFIDARFRGRDGGFATAVPGAGPAAPRPQRDENIAVARFANLLARHTGRPADRERAEHAMRYLATPEVARRFNTGGVLLADSELRRDPLHVTVVGADDDPAARALLQAALALPGGYKRVELWDRRRGPLPNADVTYPATGRPAAYLCVEGRCSAPARRPAELRDRLAGPRGRG
jgi:uncharacterized protein YyaL (SSP411 family)